MLLKVVDLYLPVKLFYKCFQKKMIYKSPDSSGVEHLHGKQAVVGSIPILGKKSN